MNEKLYSLIINKPKKEIYCKCCLVDSFPGYNDNIQWLTKQRVIDYSVEYLTKERDPSDYEPDICVIHNTGHFSNVSGQIFSEDLTDEEDVEWTPIYNEIWTRVKKIKEEQIEIAKKKKEEELIKQKSEQENREKAQLKALKEKYG